MAEDIVDTSQAVEIAPRVWWVGSMIPDDNFQCHVYLIEQGDQSVLIDPGSALIADEIIRKVDDVVGLGNVRWLVCSHADPDILGALPTMVAHGLHPEARIVTHWRDEALIVHTGTPLHFWRIEENDWRLALEDRTLQFVFIPYLHFAGAFGTFDPSSGVLFSSDLFGGFTDDRQLYASSVAYFDAIRAFHEHYMPNREILQHAIEELRELPIQVVAPQHGQVIPQHLIAPIMSLLEKLECGIYLLAREDPGLAFLLQANRTIHGVIDAMVREDRFAVVVSQLAQFAAENLGASYLELWSGRDSVLLKFDQDNDFLGESAEAPSDVAAVLRGEGEIVGERMIWPLDSSMSHEIVGALVLGFVEAHELDAPKRSVLIQILGLVEVALEREVLLRSSDLERSAWKARALHDSLTGLYNRRSLDESLRSLLSLDDRNAVPMLAAVMFDVDYFKRVNDNFGHPSGDRVLQRVAQAIGNNIRPTDLAFRYGGEEFLVLLANIEPQTVVAIAERIRSSVATEESLDPHVTISAGIAFRRRGEDEESLIDRVDDALYLAKANGRDQVRVAE